MKNVRFILFVALLSFILFIAMRVISSDAFLNKKYVFSGRYDPNSNYVRDEDRTGWKYTQPLSKNLPTGCKIFSIKEADSFIVAIGSVNKKTYAWIFDKKLDLKNKFLGVDDDKYDIITVKNSSSDGVVLLLCGYDSDKVLALDSLNSAPRVLKIDFDISQTFQEFFLSRNNLFFIGSMGDETAIKEVNIRDGSERTPFTKSGKLGLIRSASMSPDGNKIAFTISPYGDRTCDLYLCDLISMNVEILIKGNDSFHSCFVQKWKTNDELIVAAEGADSVFYLYGVDTRS